LKSSPDYDPAGANPSRPAAAPGFASAEGALQSKPSANGLRIGNHKIPSPERANQTMPQSSHGMVSSAIPHKNGRRRRGTKQRKENG